MAQNIIEANSTSTVLGSRFQTTCSPIMINYIYTGGGATPIPAMIQAQVQVDIDGTYTDVGAPLIISRRPTSAVTNPEFLFDISKVLQAYIESGDYIDSSGNSILTSPSNTFISLTNSSSYVFKNAIKYRVNARAYFLNDNSILTLNEDDLVESNPAAGQAAKYACDFFLKDEIISPSVFANMVDGSVSSL